MGDVAAGTPWWYLTRTMKQSGVIGHPDPHWPCRIGGLLPLRRPNPVLVFQPLLAGAWRHVPGIGCCSAPARALAPCVAPGYAAWTSPLLRIARPAVIREQLWRARRRAAFTTA